MFFVVQVVQVLTLQATLIQESPDLNPNWFWDNKLLLEGNL